MRRIIIAACSGAAVFIEFAAVECFFASIIPWMILPRASYAPVFRDATLAFIAIYAALGALAGGIVAFASERMDVRQAGVSLVLVVMFLGNAMRSLQRGAFLLAELVAVVAAVLILRGVRHRRLLRGWSLGFLLLFPFWASQEMFPARSPRFKVAMALGALLIAVAGALLCGAGNPAGVGTSFAGRIAGATQKRRFLRGAASPLLVLVIVTASLIAGQSSVALPPSDAAYHSRIVRPNVVLITMDTVRADHLPLYGYRRLTTPNLADLARTWTIYARAIASSNETLATHASIFTGLYASKHGAHPFEASEMVGGAPLDRSIPTLAQVLNDGGYATFAVVANYAYLAEDFGLSRGFDVYDCRPPTTLFHPNQPHLPRQLFASVFANRRVTMFRDAAEINAQALRVIERQRGGGRPFFLFINYMDAHAPYEPPPPFDTQFRDENPATPAGVVPAALRDQVNAYDGGIAYMDQQIGRLIAALRRRNLYEDTIVVIMADHGESFGEKGFWGHGLSVYEPQVHIPLLVKYPQQLRGATVASLASEVDIAPTILAAVHAVPARAFDGTSLTAMSGRPVISEAFKIGWNIEWIGPGARDAAELQTQKALSYETFKLIEGKKHSALFDLLTDPAETVDRSANERPTYDQLHGELAEWRRANAPRPGSSPLREETIRRLRSLGYLR
jgi:arylsulfatase A-like enzyme